MRKEYKLPGRNELIIDDRSQNERYKTITFEIRDNFIAAPLSKPKVKELVKDLQKWLKEDS